MRLAGLILALAPLAHAAGAFVPRTILFVDDHDVLYRAGLTRKAVPFEKFPGNPVIAPDKPWESATIAWNSVHRDPVTGRFQLWYAAHGQRADDKRFKNVVCYAESADGKTWTKPHLGLFPYYEEKDTNIVLIGNGGYGDRYCCSVLYDEHDKDAQRRYKMVYYDWDIGETARLGSGTRVAFSPDGIHWTKHGPMVSKTGYGSKGQQPPLRGEDFYNEAPGKNGATRRMWRVPLSMSDAADVFYDPAGKNYVIYGKMWIPGPDGALSWKHAMGRTESDDFLHWSKPELILTTSDRDPPMLEFHTSPVFYYRDLYLSLNQILDRAAGTIDLELMSSRDGRKWERSFTATPIIARGQGEVFDSGSLFSNSTPVLIGDEMRFYYGAYRGTAVGGVGLDRQKVGSGDNFSGIGFAFTPRDRLVALAPDPASSVKNPPPKSSRPPNTIGQVTLRPLDLEGAREILINANASAGNVRVEILDEDGYRMPGFTKDEALPLQADGLAQPAAWKTRSLADLAPGRYLVRLHLDNAELFAVTLN